MAVAVVIDVPNGNQQFYDQIVPRLFPEGKLPEDWQLHIAGPTESGWRIVNVVPSQAQFEAFARERLGPALLQLEGDFNRSLSESHSAQQLVDKMMALHGAVGNPYTLWTAAQAMFQQAQVAAS